MLKPSLQLKLGQQLTMTPQLQQAIRLLQLPILDLQMQIREALESNVMLESSEDSAEATATDQRENGADDVPVVEQEWSGSQTAAAPGTSWNSGEPRPTQEFEDHSGETLTEYLRWQLMMESLTSRQLAIAGAIVDAVNDDGYLTDDLDTICTTLQPDLTVLPDEAESILQLVHRLDPIGVGARNISECIELQLRPLKKDTPGLELAVEIARFHLESVAEHQMASLRRHLRLTESELQDAVALVRSCHPRPGSAVNASTPEYVIPDVYIRKLDNCWVVEINSSTTPLLRVNKTYASLLGRNSEHAVLRGQLQEARWLVRSLEIRNETILKVAKCIVERQRDFLEQGEEAMQPMVLRDVAEAVDMHESTISRVTTNKYMHTPRGVFEFRYFFSSHVTGTDGTEQSSVAIRAKIRKLIARENPQKPLSDNKIAKELSKDGVTVARRTIAKYREAMTIPPSSERKRLSLR